MLTKLYDRFAKQSYVKTVRFISDRHFKIYLGQQVYIEVECFSKPIPKDFLFIRCGEQVLCNEWLPQGFVAKNIDLIIKRIERLTDLTFALEKDLAVFKRCNDYRLAEAGFVKEQENAD